MAWISLGRCEPATSGDGANSETACVADGASAPARDLAIVAGWLGLIAGPAVPLCEEERRIAAVAALGAGLFAAGRLRCMFCDAPTPAVPCTERLTAKRLGWTSTAARLAVSTEGVAAAWRGEVAALAVRCERAIALAGGAATFTVGTFDERSDRLVGERAMVVDALSVGASEGVLRAGVVLGFEAARCDGCDCEGRSVGAEVGCLLVDGLGALRFATDGASTARRDLDGDAFWVLAKTGRTSIFC